MFLRFASLFHNQSISQAGELRVRRSKVQDPKRRSLFASNSTSTSESSKAHLNLCKLKLKRRKALALI
jgi:hypothetical protein